jgi:hypothetical protein
MGRPCSISETREPSPNCTVGASPAPISLACSRRYGSNLLKPDEIFRKARRRVASAVLPADQLSSRSSDCAAVASALSLPAANRSYTQASSALASSRRPWLDRKRARLVVVLNRHANVPCRMAKSISMTRSQLSRISNVRGCYHSRHEMRILDRREIEENNVDSTANLFWWMPPSQACMAKSYEPSCCIFFARPSARFHLIRSVFFERFRAFWKSLRAPGRPTRWRAVCLNGSSFHGGKLASLNAMVARRR